MLVGVIGTILYIVFSILYLVNDYSIAKDCDDSYLWEYILVSLILFIIFGSLNSKNVSDENKTNTNFIILSICSTLFMEIGLLIWGYIELFQDNLQETTNIECNELKNSNLWKIGLTNAIHQSISVVLIFIIILISICIKKNNDIVQTSEITPGIIYNNK